MYTGHFGIALAGAGLARRLTLALLILATFAGDIIEGVVAAFNVVDTTRVWSHSLPITFGAGVVLAVGWRLKGGWWRDGAVLVVVSASHTAADFVTGVKAWWPGEPVAGWNLYQRPFADTAIEALVCVIGWAIWLRALPRERRTSWEALAPLVLLILAQFGLLVYHDWYEPPADSGLSNFIR